jgi:hypothetical protein
VVKSTGFKISSKGPGSHPRHPHDYSDFSIAPVPPGTHTKHIHAGKTAMYIVLYFFVVVFEMGCTFCSPGCPGTHSVVQAGLELTEIHLPLLPECWLTACATTSSNLYIFFKKQTILLKKKRFILCIWIHCSCLETHQKTASDLITDGCEPPCGCWELNPGPLEVKRLFLTTEPSLQLQLFSFKLPLNMY